MEPLRVRVLGAAGRSRLQLQAGAANIDNMRTLAALFGLVSLPLVGCSISIGTPSDEASGGKSASGGSGGGSGSSSGGTGNCAAGQEWFEGRCVDPLRRYEPTARIDFNNVVSYGEAPQLLNLPDPPHSGFRLIVAPRTLPPGVDIETCVAWAYPALVHTHVYAARVYVNTGLHHSNMYGMPLDATLGPSPYPDCNTGQSDLFAHVNQILGGTIPDVLFANSTQIQGGEQIVFPPGMAFRLTTDGREVASSIHFLNTGAQDQRIEVVYDFFTMPADKVTTELVPYYFDNFAFSVPPSTTADVTTTCNVFGGNLVSLMPHTHQRAQNFTVDLLATDGTEQRIYTRGDFDTDSHITVFPQPISLDGISQIRHTCTIQNDLTTPIVYGIGTNEMCTLFGYMYPPQDQVLGVVLNNATTCTAINIGANRPP